jgi:hypothetical protein
MQIVICTGIGLVILAALVAGVVELSWIFTLGYNKLGLARLHLPEILNGLSALLLLVGLGGFVLLVAHDAGCHVIHFVMKH